MSVLCEHTRAISTDSWPDHTFQTQWRALTSVSNVSWRYISGARCHAYDDGRKEVRHRRERFQQDLHTLRGEMQACRARKPRRWQDGGHRCYPRPELGLTDTAPNILGELLYCHEPSWQPRQQGLSLKVKQTRQAYVQGKAGYPCHCSVNVNKRPRGLT